MTKHHVICTGTRATRLHMLAAGGHIRSYLSIPPVMTGLSRRYEPRATLGLRNRAPGRSLSWPLSRRARCHVRGTLLPIICRYQNKYPRRHLLALAVPREEIPHYARSTHHEPPSPPALFPSHSACSNGNPKPNVHVASTSPAQTPPTNTSRFPGARTPPLPLPVMTVPDRSTAPDGAPLNPVKNRRRGRYGRGCLLAIGLAGIEEIQDLAVNTLEHFAGEGAAEGPADVEGVEDVAHLV